MKFHFHEFSDSHLGKSQLFLGKKYYVILCCKLVLKIPSEFSQLQENNFSLKPLKVEICDL